MRLVFTRILYHTSSMTRPKYIIIVRNKKRSEKKRVNITGRKVKVFPYKKKKTFEWKIISGCATTNMCVYSKPPAIAKNEKKKKGERIKKYIYTNSFFLPVLAFFCLQHQNYQRIDAPPQEQLSRFNNEYVHSFNTFLVNVSTKK